MIWLCAVACRTELHKMGDPAKEAQFAKRYSRDSSAKKSCADISRALRRQADAIPNRLKTDCLCLPLSRRRRSSHRLLPIEAARRTTTTGPCAPQSTTRMETQLQNCELPLGQCRRATIPGLVQHRCHLTCCPSSWPPGSCGHHSLRRGRRNWIDGIANAPDAATARGRWQSHKDSYTPSLKYDDDSLKQFVG
jgi:hypothetical protein